MLIESNEQLAKTIVLRANDKMMTHYEADRPTAPILQKLS